MYYVYILWSSKSKIFYSGYTENLRNRIGEHNKGLSKLEILIFWRLWPI